MDAPTPHPTPDPTREDRHLSNRISIELPINGTPVKPSKPRAPRKASKPAPAPAATPRPWTRLLPLAYPAACFGLAGCFLGISLPHLATGAATIVAAGPVASWIMAVCMDLSQVVAEVGIITGRGDKHICKWVVRTSAGLSAILNIIHFIQHAESLPIPYLSQVLAVVFGVLFPAGVLVMSHLGADSLMTRRGK
jgi:hypothetical protein